MVNKIKKFYILKIPFIDGNYHEAMTMLINGGLMVVPAAPALATIRNNQRYYEALLKCDFAIPDSGFMVLIMKFFKGINISRLSGVEFLRLFIKNVKKNERFFLVDPSNESRNKNNEFLLKNGFSIQKNDHYVAPQYEKSNIVDSLLLNIIEKKRPKFIIINLGGGVQEPLGLFLKECLSFRPAIICTGAAIAILSGEQAKTPKWVDKLYLGWLARCINNPKVFIPRYLNGFKLFPMLLKEKIQMEESEL